MNLYSGAVVSGIVKALVGIRFLEVKIDGFGVICAGGLSLFLLVFFGGVEILGILGTLEFLGIFGTKNAPCGAELVCE